MPYDENGNYYPEPLDDPGPDMQPPPPGDTTTPPPVTTIPPVNTPGVSPDGALAVILQLLNAGMTPADAITKAGHLFGFEPGQDGYPKFYPENGTIGLKNGYLDNAQGTWKFNPRGPKGPGGGIDMPGLIDPYGGQPPPGFAPPPGSALPGPFRYADFEAPSYEEAFNEPGYRFAVGEGRQALENSAFGKGVGRTGGTLKDLIKYGQAAGATQYQNVFDRKLTGWQANQGNQSGIFGTNKNLAQDVYGRYKSFYELGRDTFTNWQDKTFSKLYDQQRLGLDANQ